MSKRKIRPDDVAPSDTKPYAIEFDGQFHVRQCYSESHAREKAEAEFGLKSFTIRSVRELLGKTR